MNNFLSNPDIDAHDKKLVDQYKKRKHLNIKSIKSFNVTKGSNFALERTKLETELTAEMLRTKDWKDTKFKGYNFKAEGIDPHGGHVHPLLSVRE